MQGMLNLSENERLELQQQAGRAMAGPIRRGAPV
jgi:hypothetical protein